MAADSNPSNSYSTALPFSKLQYFQYFFFIVVILYVGKSLFIPLSFALLISFLLYPICKWLEKKGINSNIAIGISLLGVSVFGFALLLLFVSQVLQFAGEWHNLETKLEETLHQFSLYLTQQFGVNQENQSVYLKNALNSSGSSVISILRNTIAGFTESLYYLIIVPIFSILILSYRKMLVNALYHFFALDKKATIHEIITETINEYYKFIKGMLLVYLIVGILNSIGLAIVGIPYPILFGFTAAILTFIPYFGIIISSLVPITMAWITFNSIWYPIGVVIVFAVVQLLEAYIIFPYAVGSRLKINTLAILIMILAGGILWGAAGMILFIPFISIIKLIADRTTSLQSVSLLLSDGKSNP